MQTFDFIQIKATKQEVGYGESVTLEAEVSGKTLRFNWFSEFGILSGNGATVRYSAPCCDTGEYEVSCTVSDGKREETRSIIIKTSY